MPRTKKPKMEELAPSKLSRPLDRDNLSNDTGTLQQLVGMLNKGVVVPPALSEQSTTTPTESPRPVTPSLPTAPSASPSAPPLSTNRLFLTGRPGAGVRSIAGRLNSGVVYSPEDEVKTFAFAWAGELVVDDNLLKQLRAWGEGVVDKQYPLTLERIWVVHTCQQIDSHFGKPGFWIKRLLQIVNGVESSPHAFVQRIVVDVTTLVDFNLLREAGFTHFHVLVSNQTLSKNNPIGTPVVPDMVSAALDNDVLKKISKQRTGERLRCIWNDTAAAPSNRFYSVDDFVKAVSVTSENNLPRVEL